MRLTEILGSTPGSRLALAQGEAALSAQEAPHPCPACGGARSCQPPVTSCLEVGAAVERQQTPSCRSSPGFDSLERLPPSLPPPEPSKSIPTSQKVTSVGFPGRPLSPIPVRRPEEPSQGEDGQKSGCPSWARWFSLSLTPSRD